MGILVFRSNQTIITCLNAVISLTKKRKPKYFNEHDIMKDYPLFIIICVPLACKHAWLRECCIKSSQTVGGPEDIIRQLCFVLYSFYNNLTMLWLAVILICVSSVNTFTATNLYINSYLADTKSKPRLLIISNRNLTVCPRFSQGSLSGSNCPLDSGPGGCCPGGRSPDIITGCINDARFPVNWY